MPRPKIRVALGGRKSPKSQTERTRRTFVPLKAFLDLGLAAPLVDALAREGYETPTPIQAQAIPPALQGRDLLGTAQTGTGKTAAFTLPILQHLMPIADHPGKRPIRVLILTPTRELALQIDESIGTYGANVALSHTVILAAWDRSLKRIRSVAEWIFSPPPPVDYSI